MSKRRPRGLRPDERRLWEAYTGGRPALPGREEARSPPEPPTPEATTPTPEPRLIPPFRIGEKSPRGKESVAIASAAQPWDAPARLDAKTFSRLKKGRADPDARIDLHGKTVEEAHRALIAFVLARRARGDRLILVITGKGTDMGPVPGERGVLRRQVPHWLRLPPLAQAVLDVRPAHRRHGGDGAFYVALRKLR